MGRGLIAALALLLLGVAPAPSDEAVLRAVLVEIAARDRYCVSAALTEAPFADIRREMAQYAADARAVAAVEGRPLPPARSEADMRRNILDQVGSGWMGPDDKWLPAATLEAIRRAAAALAYRGDPTPLPVEPVIDMNASAAAGETAAPATPPFIPPDHGSLPAAWLVKGQRLRTEEPCDLPSASLSAVAREGAIAFVDVGFVWGPLAGAGYTWAMRRDDRGMWKLIARRRTWMA